jgi:hypothetical protein
MCLIGSVLCFAADAQELKARVTVVTTRVANNVNRNAFLTLQTALTNFLNTRKWTNDTYAPNERIDCNFLLNLESTDQLNVFNATLSVQAARPIFNSSYLSPIINYRDESVAFKYQEFQQLEFNENRVTGNDPLISNLTAVFAYYAYMVIGFDAMSFAQHGGDPFFQKAQNIVNNAPDGRNISGWKAFDGIRNRYWLAENVLNTRYEVMHQIYYQYYRLGMDKFYSDENAGRTELLNTLNMLDKYNTDNPNTMINQFFFLGKSTELVQIFKRAKTQDRVLASGILSRLDITNANKYKEELK